MSIYTCKLCDQQKDRDENGCYEYEDGLICEDCNENSGLPEIKPIPKVTSKCVEVGMDITKEDFARTYAEEILADYPLGPGAAPDWSQKRYAVAQAYLTLLARWNGLDDNNERIKTRIRIMRDAGEPASCANLAAKGFIGLVEELLNRIEAKK